ncbi:hypothetical protein DFH07DRAFT_769203 [Mycena maculata]|uniref:Uncharacterized protein n=1 Tax=Mycena maculata TaxID=230809 RepID=A0AAD7JR47_9AGAR|nr:hypothetical protein DFH07DRAFT_769203 [Mycena maculata]
MTTFFPPDQHTFKLAQCKPLGLAGRPTLQPKNFNTPNSDAASIPWLRDIFPTYDAFAIGLDLDLFAYDGAEFLGDVVSDFSAGASTESEAIPEQESSWATVNVDILRLIGEIEYNDFEVCAMGDGGDSEYGRQQDVDAVDVMPEFGDILLGLLHPSASGPWTLDSGGHDSLDGYEFKAASLCDEEESPWMAENKDILMLLEACDSEPGAASADCQAETLGNVLSMFDDDEPWANAVQYSAACPLSDSEAIAVCLDCEAGTPTSVMPLFDDGEPWASHDHYSVAHPSPAAASPPAHDPFSVSPSSPQILDLYGPLAPLELDLPPSHFLDIAHSSVTSLQSPSPSPENSQPEQTASQGSSEYPMDLVRMSSLSPSPSASRGSSECPIDLSRLLSLSPTFRGVSEHPIDLLWTPPSSPSPPGRSRRGSDGINRRRAPPERRVMVLNPNTGTPWSRTHRRCRRPADLDVAALLARVQPDHPRGTCAWGGCGAAIATDAESVFAHMQSAHKVRRRTEDGTTVLLGCLWRGCSEMARGRRWSVDTLVTHVRRVHLAGDDVSCPYCPRDRAPFYAKYRLKAHLLAPLRVDVEDSEESVEEAGTGDVVSGVTTCAE